jgi:hypothetical protein
MKALDYSSHVSLLGLNGRYFLAVPAAKAKKIVDDGHGEALVTRGLVRAIQLIAPVEDDSKRPSRQRGLGLGGTRYVYAARVGAQGERQGIVYSFDMSKIESGIRPPEDAPEDVVTACASAPFVQVLNECAA